MKRPHKVITIFKLHGKPWNTLRRVKHIKNYESVFKTVNKEEDFLSDLDKKLNGKISAYIITVFNYSDRNVIMITNYNTRKLQDTEIHGKLCDYLKSRNLID